MIPRAVARWRFFLIAVATFACSAGAAFATSDPVLEAAEAYSAYRSDVAALQNTRLGALSDLEAALERAARHNRVSLSRGWIAYGALQATRSRAFVDGVNRVARRSGRDAVLRALASDPAYTARRPGYREALSLIYAAGAADEAAAETAAQRLEGEAPLASAWADTSSNEARAARLRRLGAATFVSRADTRRISLDTPRLPRGRQPAVSSTREAIARRMTTVAAMRILEADGRGRTNIGRMLEDPRTQSCLRMANLQFYQCVSVTHTPDEAAYCLARHGLREVSGCMSF